jgi:aldose 1-epimerase
VTNSPNYSVRREESGGVETVHLRDAARRAEVAIAPRIGNMAYEFRLSGRNLLWFPFESPARLKANPTLCGVPFLAPWANRVDGEAYWVNGAHYRLNPELGNLRRDGNGLPIHGLLNFSPLWQLVEATADELGAHATSRLEFWRFPALMAQFPFAHAITMTYRLSNGELEVETTLENLSEDPMPVAIGYHPYFRVDDAPRANWKAHVAARGHVELNARLIPTGEVRRSTISGPHPLSEGPLDDVFHDLERAPDGRAVFWVEGERQRISVSYGPKYPIAVVYAPEGGEFICFEPMAAPTNAFNLDHAGLWKGLESIPPGGAWRESFWISGSGF